MGRKTVPSKIFVGINKLTGEPVSIDLGFDLPKNVILAGEPAPEIAKLFLVRASSLIDVFSVFVADTRREYGRAAKAFGAKIVEICRGRQTIISPELLRDESTFASSVLEDLGVSEKGGTALETLLKDRYGSLFQGSPMEVAKRTVFSFSELTGDRDELSTACLLTLCRVWYEVERMPRSRLKVILLDEPKLFAGVSSTFGLLSHVLRRTRTRNVVLLLVCRQPRDLSSVLRALDCYFYTKIFAFPRASRGAFADGLLEVGFQKTRTPLSFTVTKEEYKLLATSLR